MHREVIEVPRSMDVDHINQNGLDNRKANLRPATHTQNNCNRKKFSKNTYSKYKGVCWKKKIKKWTAQIGFNNKMIFLGYFHDEVAAAKAYDQAAIKYHREFAALNFESPMSLTGTQSNH